MAIGYPLALVAMFFVSVLFRAVVHHGLVGGRRSSSASLWTIAYLHALYVAVVPLGLVQGLVPGGPFLASPGDLGLEAMMAVQLARAAERYHDLARSRAKLAGFGTAAGIGVALFTSYALFGYGYG